MNDGAPPLTLDQLKDLTKLCQKFDHELQQIGSIPLSQCSIVMFASRSLDHCLCRVDYAFKKTDNSDIFEQEYDDKSFNIVQNVVSETDQQLDKYLDKVNAKGHRWGEHYNSIWTETLFVR